MRELRIPDKCTSGCYFRVQDQSERWRCELYRHAINHIIHAKKCSNNFLRFYKNKNVGLRFWEKSGFATKIWSLAPCYRCHFLRGYLLSPWCALFKIPINEIRHAQDGKRERAAEKIKGFKKCKINFVFLFRPKDPCPGWICCPSLKYDENCNYTYACNWEEKMKLENKLFLFTLKEGRDSSDTRTAIATIEIMGIAYEPVTLFCKVVKIDNPHGIYTGVLATEGEITLWPHSGIMRNQNDEEDRLFRFSTSHLIDGAVRVSILKKI